MIMECSYAVTAWTQAVEDEHRLLSQVLGVLFAFPELPADALAGRLAETAQRFAIEGRIGQPKSDGKADFWSAVGGQYKASLDYVVTLACESGMAYERGPEVRTQTMGASISDGPAGTVTELHRFGGKVFDGDGKPLHDAWITLPELGLFAASDRHGRFVLQRVPSGKHKLIARTREGTQATAEIAVPGRRPRPHGRAQEARREAGQLIEWASAAARTAAPATLAHRAPDRRSWADDGQGRTRPGHACSWGTSNRSSGWACSTCSRRTGSR